MLPPTTDEVNMAPLNKKSVLNSIIFSLQDTDKGLCLRLLTVYTVNYVYGYTED